MSGDPFAPLTRQARWRARLLSCQRALLRPVRPSHLTSRREGPPNLLLMGVDTLRADHVGCLGGGLATTPHLDRTSVSGTVFTDVTAPAPWTLPSFAGALTGLMPGLHGGYLGAATRNMDKQPPRRLDPAVVTLAGHLARQGYRTAAFYSNQFFAFGLAESFGNHAYHNLAAGDLARVALDWMRRNADRPFFCFVLFNDPHEPTTPRPGDLEPFLPAGAPTADLGLLSRWGQPPLPDLGRAPLPTGADVERVLELKRSIYAGTVHQVDGAIGMMQRQLEDWELAPRTVCSVFSDHGEEFRDHAAEAARWGHDPRGLLGIGHGHTQFQELLHVPWLAWGPGVPTGTRETRPVSLCDLGPTLTDWLGVASLPLADSEPGRRAAASGLPLLGRSQAAGDQTAESDRVLLAEALAFGPDLVALRRGRWKLIAHRDGRPLALYDLAEDPGEERDRQAEAETARQDLLGVLERWRASGLGATDDQAGNWQDLDETVRNRLKDLGYSE